MAKKIEKVDILKDMGIEPVMYTEKQVRKFIIDAFLEGAVCGEMFNNENRCFMTDAINYYNEFLND